MTACHAQPAAPCQPRTVHDRIAQGQRLLMALGVGYLLAITVQPVVWVVIAVWLVAALVVLALLRWATGNPFSDSPSRKPRREGAGVQLVDGPVDGGDDRG